MLIYQIHEYTGEYEDFSDIIVATYANLDTADQHMNNLKKIAKEKEIMSDKCACCPVNNMYIDDVAKFDKDVKNYCNSFVLDEDYAKYDEVECKNHYMLDEYPTYKIETVKVLDA